MPDTDPTSTPAPEAPPAAEPPKAAGGSKRGGRRQPAADKPPRGPGRPSNFDKLEEALTDQFMTLGMLATMANPVDGQIIMAGAPNLAGALIVVAKENRKVEQSLKRLTETSAWAGVIFAVTGIVVPIAANHGLLPAGPMVDMLVASKTPEAAAA